MVKLAATPLASLATEGIAASLGGNVTTTGNQKFGSDVTLTGDTKFSIRQFVDLSGLVGGGHNVEIDAVNAIIDAQKYSVSGIADLIVSGDVGLNVRSQRLGISLMAVMLVCSATQP